MLLLCALALSLISAAVVPEELFSNNPNRRRRVQSIMIPPSRHNNESIPTTIINTTTVPFSRRPTGIRRQEVADIDYIAVSIHTPPPNVVVDFVRFAYTETRTAFVCFIIGCIIFVFGIWLVVYVWTLSLIHI